MNMRSERISRGAVIKGVIVAVVAIGVVFAADAANLIDLGPLSLSVHLNSSRSNIYRIAPAGSGPAPAGLTLYGGTVTDADGAPVAGVRVCLGGDLATGCPADTLTTGADGKWATYVDPNQKLPFIFEASGYKMRKMTQSDVLNLSQAVKGPNAVNVKLAKN